jgi:hypothetical protein
MRTTILSTFLAAGIAIAAGHACLAQQDQATTPQSSGDSAYGCQVQTVDSYGQAEGVQYRYWMLDLKKAVKQDDRKLIAEHMVNYPLIWNRHSGTVTIPNSKDFLKSYDEIFTPQLKQRIALQNVKCLPGDDEGASVANGKLRFSKFASGHYFSADSIHITSVTEDGFNIAQKLPWE